MSVSKRVTDSTSPWWKSWGSGHKLYSTNPIERRTDVVGIFPNEVAVVRLVGALFLEQSDEWATQPSRYMTLETIGAISDTASVSLPAAAY